MNDKLEETAIHEAGHAVVAYLLGEKVIDASIIEDEDSFGHVKWSLPDGFDPDDEEHESAVKNGIMIGFAGALAEELSFGSYDEQGVEDDFYKAVNWACFISGSSEERQQIVDAKWDETKRLLSQNWDMVIAVADQLRITNKLNTNQLLGILDAVHNLEESV